MGGVPSREPRSSSSRHSKYNISICAVVAVHNLKLLFHLRTPCTYNLAWRPNGYRENYRLSNVWNWEGHILDGYRLSGGRLGESIIHMRGVS